MAKARGYKRGTRWKKLSMEDYINSFWSRVEKAGNDDCWLWTGKTDRDGYGKMGCTYLQPACLLAHRFSMMLKLKRILLPQEKVLHHCDNPPCVNPNHLFIGTNQDNTKDMVGKDRQAKGELIASSKLTAKKVRKIRKMFKEGFNGVKLSEIFEVSNVLIYLIVKRKVWRHVT